jgi:hypothetical protein
MRRGIGGDRTLACRLRGGCSTLELRIRAGGASQAHVGFCAFSRAGVDGRNRTSKQTRMVYSHLGSPMPSIHKIFFCPTSPVTALETRKRRRPPGFSRAASSDTSRRDDPRIHPYREARDHARGSIRSPSYHAKGSAGGRRGSRPAARRRSPSRPRYTDACPSPFPRFAYPASFRRSGQPFYSPSRRFHFRRLPIAIGRWRTREASNLHASASEADALPFELRIQKRRRPPGLPGGLLEYVTS